MPVQHQLAFCCEEARQGQRVLAKVGGGDVVKRALWKRFPEVTDVS